jgi:hypothetical protein
MDTTTHGAPKPAHDDSGIVKAAEFNNAMDAFDAAIWAALNGRIVQQPYTSADPWTPTLAMGTVGAEIRFECPSVDHDLVFATPTGSPVNGQLFTFVLLSTAAAKALDFTTCTAFVPVSAVLPTTTQGVLGALTVVSGRYNTTRGKYMVYGVSQE